MIDGIVVIVQEIEDGGNKKGTRKVSGENKVREELLIGASVKEVFNK